MHITLQVQKQYKPTAYIADSSVTHIYKNSHIKRAKDYNTEMKNEPLLDALIQATIMRFANVPQPTSMSEGCTL